MIAHGGGRGRVHARGPGGLLNLGGVHRPDGAGLGGQHPNEPVAVEIRLGVYKEIRQVVLITVIGAPPYDRRVGDVLIILVDQLRAGLREM